MDNWFWVVWNDNGGVPTFKHSSFGSAKTEAERLARGNPGQKFHVLQLVGTAKRIDVEWTEIPFEPPF